MTYKRILTIQDISCVGQCSMTVALPILSACGHETCILPTALLSTHTGGFGKPAVIHLEDSLGKIWRHWKENNIVFDAILVGYLGSTGAIAATEEITEQLLAPGGILIVDPAMADHGKLYSGLSREYAEQMKRLCDRADIVLPNITEAAMFAGISYREQYDEAYITQLLKTYGHPCVVLTGVGYTREHTGAVLYENGRLHYRSHTRVEQNFHGTGDMFAASFTGALMQGKGKEEAVSIASEFVLKSILHTRANPAHWYGVKFEAALPDLIRILHTDQI